MTQTAMTPYRVETPDADLDDLRDRLERTRFPAPLPGDGWNTGVPVAYLRKLVTYWRDHFDWRETEAKLNRYPGFVTTIDGTTIHFLHV